MATSIFDASIHPIGLRGRKSPTDLRRENQRISNYDNGSNPIVDHWLFVAKPKEITANAVALGETAIRLSPPGRAFFPEACHRQSA
jgi:hypothetical protein